MPDVFFCQEQNFKFEVDEGSLGFLESQLTVEKTGYMVKPEFKQLCDGILDCLG